jgi:hypothetical protein
VAASTGTGFTNQYWGSWSAVTWNDLRVGDFNNDGRDDIIGREGGNWWIGQGGTFFSTSLWGSWSELDWSNVRVGDYDGDGKEDLAGWGNGVLNVQNS